MNRTLMGTLAGLALATLTASPAVAQTVVFNDPTGDDNGPGSYTYPTDSVYLPGSFDLTEFKVEEKGGNVDFSVSVQSRLADPWGMGVGFAVQMAFIFIDTGEGGNTEGIPGLNVEFAEDSRWDRVVILSPQQQSRVLSEARVKVADLLAAGAVVVPRRTTGRGKTISARVSKDEIGSGDIASWGYQVVLQSNEGFPDRADLLTRRVNEYEGQHRFGGGHDSDCDPHVMDVLAGQGKGAPEDGALQKEMLAYECGPDGESVKRATLRMVRQ